MRPCKDIVPLIGPMLDGELPADDREYVEDHVSGCESCALRRDLIVAQGAALREKLAAAQADFAGLADGVMARIQREEPLRGAEKRTLWRREMWGAHKRAIGAVAGMAVAASLALGVVFTPPRVADDDEQPVALASAQVEEVDFGSHDGAVMELPHDTTMIWVSEGK